MAYISQNKKIIIITLKSPEIDPIKAFTINLRLLLWEINLRGLNVLKSLKIFKEERLSPPKSISNMLVETIKKSKQFQESLK